MTFSSKATGTTGRDSGAGLMVDTVVAIGCGDQSPVSFNLSSNGRTVFADVLCNLCYLKSLLEPRLDRQSVIIGKVFLAHKYLQSEGRTGTTIPEDDRKRNHEVAVATLWLPVHVILNATGYVAFNFSINLR